MDKKDLIRKSYFLKRKKNFFDIKDDFFFPLIKLIKKNKIRNKNISIYYPNSYEVNILKILDLKFFKTFNFESEVSIHKALNPFPSKV